MEFTIAYIISNAEKNFDSIITLLFNNYYLVIVLVHIHIKQETHFELQILYTIWIYNVISMLLSNHNM